MVTEYSIVTRQFAGTVETQPGMWTTSKYGFLGQMLEYTGEVGSSAPHAKDTDMAVRMVFPASIPTHRRGNSKRSPLTKGQDQLNTKNSSADATKTVTTTQLPHTPRAVLRGP